MVFGLRLVPVVMRALFVSGSVRVCVSVQLCMHACVMHDICGLSPLCLASGSVFVSEFVLPVCACVRVCFVEPTSLGYDAVPLLG